MKMPGKIPVQIPAGGSVVKIYPAKVRHAGKEGMEGESYDSFLITYYEGGKRVQIRRAPFDVAYAKAKEMADAIREADYDSIHLSGRDRRIFLSAQERLEALKLDLDTAVQAYVKSATADKCHDALEEMKQLQAGGIRTVISDPVRNRRLENLAPEDAKVAAHAKRNAGSKSGKELLRRRGMHLERSFAHVLDAGGARRTTLRGLENLNKRFKASAAIYNMSQLMRKLFGVGMRKRWAAMGKALFLFLRAFLTPVCAHFRFKRFHLTETGAGIPADSTRIWQGFGLGVISSALFGAPIPLVSVITRLC